ncbi:MAG TPA: hypothetical protein VF772_13685 [Terriglobales bacterium]
MDHEHKTAGQPASVVLPASTAWPFVFAVGVALIFSGLLTNVWVSLLGFVLWVFGAVGWFRQVLPHEHHEEVPVVPEEAVTVVQPAPEVVHLEVAADVKRAWLPLKIYPVSAGVKGGLAGGVAMALLAMLYGAIFFHSIWYPINLIAGSLYAAPAVPSMDTLMHFHFGWFLFALAMHVTMCLLIGLLYGAMLPMLPTRPIILGGIVGPLLWTGLIYHILGFVNPLLDEKIDWVWFTASQIAFGVVAGLVVVRHNKVWTSENLPLAVRAGLEAPGIMHSEDHEGPKP